VAQPVFAREPGNPVPGISELLAEAGSGRVVRLWLLSTHYRRPLSAGPDSLAMWAANQRKLQDLYASLRLTAGSGGEVSSEMARAASALTEGAGAALDDDLGLNHLWPEVFGFAKQLNARLTRGGLTPAEATAARSAFDDLDRVLGPSSSPRPCRWPRPTGPRRQPALSAGAKPPAKAKDFTSADRLRQDLADLGLRVEDHPAGPRLTGPERGHRGRVTVLRSRAGAGPVARAARDLSGSCAALTRPPHAGRKRSSGCIHGVADTASRPSRPLPGLLTKIQMSLFAERSLTD
jgi:cysteinyl-tRNA synthetase